MDYAPTAQRLILDLPRAREIRARLGKLVPGGAHTYAKGDDQYPEDLAPILTRGAGCHVWDVDGNEFIEYGMGLRSVTLGHAHPAVLDAVTAQLPSGSNFTRPTELELLAAEDFLGLVTTADMVKFAKNGSDATTAAVRLARAATGRDLIAICADQPFFSTDDWFIGATAMNAGIPQAVRDLTISFRYNDLASVEHMFAEHSGRIAAVVLEPASAAAEPAPGFLAQLRELCSRAGAILIFDEMITGFRYSLHGGQGEFGVTPDLSTFGKALGNGFAVSALCGRRELMELGGFPVARERVFTMSTTHGAEGHALAAARAVIRQYRTAGVIESLYQQGARLARGVRAAIATHGLADYVSLSGRDCNLVYATRDADGQRSQEFRTLFLQELLRRGIIAPSFVVSAAHTDADIDHTVEVVSEALSVYAKALEAGVDRYLRGRPVQPVFRRFS